MSANFKKDPATTTIGYGLILLGIYMVFDTYQELGLEGFANWKLTAAPVGSMIMGLFFAKSPDSIIRWGNKAADKKLGKGDS